MEQKTVTCSFVMDCDVYNAFKSIVVKNGENVKDNLIKYMKNVIEYDIPNADTIAAIEEVEKLKNDPYKKTYSSFSDVLQHLDDE